MLKRTKKVSAFGLACTLLWACGGSSRADVDRQEERQIEYTIDIDGRFTAKVKRTVTSKFNMIHKDSVHLFGVQPVDPVILENMAIRPAIALSPYRDDGTYRIEPRPLSDPVAEQTPQTSSNRTSVELEWWPKGDLDTYPILFIRHLKQCVITVDDDGEEGRVRCPQMSLGVEDWTVSLDLRWKVR